MSTKEKWPKNCIWPEPLSEHNSYWSSFEVEDGVALTLDEEGEDFIKIKAYFDELVEEGRLNEDYFLKDDPDTDEDPFIPDMGEDYWIDDRFDIDFWEEDFCEYLNKVKIEPCETVDTLHSLLGYEFRNENLLRQAFTRKSFAKEFGLNGDCEILEFYGDMALNTIVTKIMTERLSEVDSDRTDAPFQSDFDEGDLTKIRSSFVCKEYLSQMADELDLGKYILYGTGDAESDSSKENTVEALIGALAVDSHWNWTIMESVVDNLIRIQLDKPDELTKTTNYERLNAWHQKHFGTFPNYKVVPHANGSYTCILRYSVSKKTNGNSEDVAWIETDAWSKSAARECAATRAVSDLSASGLWMNLQDAGIEPNLDDSINQLQELRQKRYIGEALYEFSQQPGGGWYCRCACNGFGGFGEGNNKIIAKKRASLMVLTQMYRSAGIKDNEWEKKMYEIAMQI